MRLSSLSILIFLFIFSCSTNNTPQYNINVTSSPSEGGTVQLAPDGGVYDEGTSVTITPSPSEGYLFSSWGGNITSANNPITITVTKDFSLNAVFEKKMYPLAIDVTGEGTVTEEIVQQKTDYEHGTVVRLTPNPGTGYEFVEWQGDVNSTESVIDVTVTSEMNITAVFEVQTFAVSITKEGDGNVSVSPDKDAYQYGESIQIIASDTLEWRFIDWSGSIISTSDTLDIEVTEEVNLTANFFSIRGKQISNIYQESNSYYQNGEDFYMEKNSEYFQNGLISYDYTRYNSSGDISISESFGSYDEASRIHELEYYRNEVYDQNSVTYYNSEMKKDSVLNVEPNGEVTSKTIYEYNADTIVTIKHRYDGSIITDTTIVNQGGLVIEEFGESNPSFAYRTVYEYNIYDDLIKLITYDTAGNVTGETVYELTYDENDNIIESRHVIWSGDIYLNLYSGHDVNGNYENRELYVNGELRYLSSYAYSYYNVQAPQKALQHSLMKLPDEQYESFQSIDNERSDKFRK